MATPLIEKPAQPEPGGPSRPSDRATQTKDPVELHFLLEELRDDYSRSRMREAVWISIILHFVVFAAIKTSPRWLPARAVQLMTAQDQLKQRELTFIEQPPDAQKLTHKPETDRISDKDRMAMSKNPTLDQKTLDEMARNRRSGPPGAVQPQQQPSPQQMAMNNPPQPQGAGQASNSQQGAQDDTPPNDEAKLKSPPQGRNNVFRSMSGAISAGSAVEQAARASAQAHGGGAGGDWGAPGGNGVSLRGNLDILSDTMGVDFNPYLQRVLETVRKNWYAIIPESARPPMYKQGTVAIQFVIMKDGSVQGMQLAGPSGDVSLDRAAWGGITASNPFPPLPGEFKGQYLALRFRFLYNPDRGSIR
ncbi:MAG: TonB family protein [Acidobacteriales bacterium]|nr:TonB family protein [Terriglobales bacterium]